MKTITGSPLAVARASLVALLFCSVFRFADGWNLLPANLPVHKQSTTAKLENRGNNYEDPSVNRRRVILHKGIQGSAAVLATGLVLVGAPSPCQAQEEISTGSNEDDPEEENRKREETLKRLQERRQLMQASRSSNNRQSYLDLSRQRAALYNTTYQGVTCPQNSIIPCI
ncbi:expressed unknown protein [Seminavis robusta]|uniref:Uncharacterized protein n=1 Tax=Seminavis robusta TaxID=568900 RepID=A0A9N8DL84_9STRA|nr:expressed unknown protein [Seminavis robusta]|eukprot:Sro146_g067550.1 n/a (170) ;mRNA; r:49429-49938